MTAITEAAPAGRADVGSGDTLVVLGAAIGVFETYRAARRLGLRTLAVDMRPDAPALDLADERLILSTRDVEAIHEALRDRDDVCGVVAPASDIALGAQHLLADRLGLPCGLSKEMVRASNDKAYLRTVCDELDLPTCRWVAGAPGEPLLAAAGRLSLPVVVKPADAQSSRGVARCATAEQMQTAIALAAPYSYSETVMVEEEILGQHLGVEAVICDQQAEFIAVSARELTAPPRAITTEHAIPAPVGEDVTEQIGVLVEALCARLGYRSGPLMLDLVLDTDGVVRVVEIGARVGGDPLGELVHAAYGLHPVECAVRVAAGIALPELPAEPLGGAVGRIVFPTVSGQLLSVSGTERAAAVEGVQRVRIGVQPGQCVDGGACLADQLGYVLASASDLGTARAQAATALEMLTFELAVPAPGPPTADVPPRLDPPGSRHPALRRGAASGRATAISSGHGGDTAAAPDLHKHTTRS